MAYEDGFCQEGAGESDEPQLHVDSRLLFLHGYLVSFLKTSLKIFRPSNAATRRGARAALRGAARRAARGLLWPARSASTQLCTNPKSVYRPGFVVQLFYKR